MKKHDISKYLFSDMYVLYLNKIKKKDRYKEELDDIICWLTGYSLNEINNNKYSMEDFFKYAPNLNPNRELIKGSICGIKLSELESSALKEIRYLDKLVDDLAKGKSLDKIKINK